MANYAFEICFYVIGFFLICLYFGFVCQSFFINVYWHTLFGNNNGSEVQIQKNGNFQVELSTFPPKPLLDANTDVFLRITSIAGDELVEVPVYPSLIKEGKINSTSLPNLTLVSG